MSQYLGRNRNKSFHRRNTKAFDYIKYLIANQDKELLEKNAESIKTKETSN